MTHSDERQPRILFVLSNDYGEYGSLRYFLHGQGFAADVRVLLPAALSGAVGDSSTLNGQVYQSAADILSVADAFRPDAVFLFSGYLMAANRLMSVRTLADMVQRLREQGCAVATSDPFLALFSDTTGSPLSPNIFLGRRRGIVARLVATWRTRWLMGEFRQAARVLRSTVHVYPAPVQCLPPEKDLTRVSYFNADFVSDKLSSEHTAGMSGAWLFVISEADLSLQELKHSQEGFRRALRDRLMDAQRQQKRPVLVAPKRLVAAFEADREGGCEAVLVAADTYDRFVGRLLAAEMAFYWNIFSNSVFLRLLQGRPVAFFDRGHLVEAVEPLLKRGVRCYYGGHEPMYLDIGCPLESGRITAVAERSRRMAVEIQEHLGRSPSPEETLRTVLCHQ